MFLCILLLVEVLAIPLGLNPKQAQVDFYHPPTTVSYSKKLHKRSLRVVTVEDAINYLSQEFDIDSKAINITQHYTDQQGVLHVYGDRLLNGIAVDNQNFGIHLKNGEILSVSSSFAKNAILSKVSKRETELELEKIISIAEKQYECKRSDFPIKKIYIQTSDSAIVSAYQFHLRDSDYLKWYQVTSDAQTGRIVQLVNYVQNINYKAVSVHKPNVKAGLEMIENPEYLLSSPLGWQNNGTDTFTDTRGNNCDSRYSVTQKRTDWASPNVFDATFDAAINPSSTQTVRAAIVNSFYGILMLTVAVNVYHDITYQFGFTEEAGNFQTNNFGKGGLENDAIIIRNYHVGERNNAYLSTPEDGIPAIMTLLVFDNRRVASFDNTVMAHEFFHGVTKRLTGGSRKANCLNDKESRSLGEGWSDFFSMLMQTNSKDTRNTDYSVGAYVQNSLNGFRIFPFSTSMQRNPLTYSDLKHLSDEHDAGEIWAVMLYEMYWNLVDEHGYSSNWYNSTKTEGNIIAFKLVMDALKIQPCNPTFLTARDAIISLAGNDACLVWKAFAKRGLGIKASSNFWGFKDDYHVPPECKSRPLLQLVFPTEGSPSEKKFRQNFKVIYPLERITHCSKFMFCYHKVFQKAKCEVGSVLGTNVEFNLSLTKASYFVYIETVSDDGKCHHKDANWNQMGYMIDIE